LNDRLRSVSVVPSGLTKHREGLPYLEAFGKSDSEKVLGQVSAWQKRFLSGRGHRTVFAADEFYVLAGKRVPGDAAYDGYPQLENGVGMLALFKKQFSDGVRRLKRSKRFEQIRALASLAPPSFILTGRASEAMIRRCADIIKAALPGLNVAVIAADNVFFGETITVAGLITGGDILNCAKNVDFPSESIVFIPKNMLKHDSELFLDDYSLEILRNMLKVDIIAIENNGGALIAAFTDLIVRRG
jgi:NifB/MoaA-like Fe-S oxidoreductase